MGTKSPQVGAWTLIAPDGTTFEDESPIKCCVAEQRTRVPQQAAANRLREWIEEEELDSEKIEKLKNFLNSFKYANDVVTIFQIREIIGQ